MSGSTDPNLRCDAVFTHSDPTSTKPVESAEPQVGMLYFYNTGVLIVENMNDSSITYSYFDLAQKGLYFMSSTVDIGTFRGWMTKEAVFDAVFLDECVPDLIVRGASISNEVLRLREVRESFKSLTHS